MIIHNPWISRLKHICVLRSLLLYDYIYIYTYDLMCVCVKTVDTIRYNQIIKHDYQMLRGFP